MLSRTVPYRAFSISSRAYAKRSLNPSDSTVVTDDIISENNPWSPTIEDDPVYVKEGNSFRKTKLPEKYRLAYLPLYEAPATKYVSIVKRLTLSVGVLGVYGAKLFWESPQFDDIYAYVTLLGTLTPFTLVHYKTRDYVTRIFRLYDKTKPQTLENLANDENLIMEKLNLTGSKTYNELLRITDNKALKLMPPPKFYTPYATWEENKDGQKREFYVMDNVGGIKMDRIWGVAEKNSGVNNGRSQL
ncbi:hypothetical protein Cantr_00990 [Candida viswanathii]|uniref:Uncharacterized protein n=1 Tax=Candida viswanathii TaxID=5486 RepID=A0A367YGQ6_9ASCO|nr:hypothetical protein Cantr_00990 [Candida viswanathii]